MKLTLNGLPVIPLDDDDPVLYGAASTALTFETLSDLF